MTNLSNYNPQSGTRYKVTSRFEQNVITKWLAPFLFLQRDLHQQVEVKPTLENHVHARIKYKRPHLFIYYKLIPTNTWDSFSASNTEQWKVFMAFFVACTEMCPVIDHGHVTFVMVTSSQVCVLIARSSLYPREMTSWPLNSLSLHMDEEFRYSLDSSVDCTTTTTTPRPYHPPWWSVHIYSSDKIN